MAEIAMETRAPETRRPGDVEHELHRRRRGRNLAVGGVLLAMALLIFTVTIVKLGANAVNPFAAYHNPSAIR